MTLALIYGARAAAVFWRETSSDAIFSAFNKILGKSFFNFIIFKFLLKICYGYNKVLLLLLLLLLLLRVFTAAVLLEKEP